MGGKQKVAYFYDSEFQEFYFGQVRLYTEVTQSSNHVRRRGTRHADAAGKSDTPDPFPLLRSPFATSPPPPPRRRTTR